MHEVFKLFLCVRVANIMISRGHLLFRSTSRLGHVLRFNDRDVHSKMISMNTFNLKYEIHCRWLVLLPARETRNNCIIISINIWCQVIMKFIVSFLDLNSSFRRINKKWRWIWIEFLCHFSKQLFGQEFDVWAWKHHQATRLHVWWWAQKQRHWSWNYMISILNSTKRKIINGIIVWLDREYQVIEEIEIIRWDGCISIAVLLVEHPTHRLCLPKSVEFHHLSAQSLALQSLPSVATLKTMKWWS